MEELVAVSLSPLVGRERDLAELRGALQQAQLVTVTGPGGVGMTRLALAAVPPARRAALGTTPAEEPAVLAVLAALGGRPEPGIDPVLTIATLVSEPGTVLLLDNCEHLHDAVAELCGALLGLVPELRILATSRFALGVPGELVFELTPLSLGIDGDAVRLFVDRARRASRGFAIDDEATDEIAQLCAALDGLPLAIELAAARTRMLSVEQITADLAAGLDMVSSLRSSIEWSYDLLAERERVLFDRLSVFAGGWELEAAETVCGEPGAPRGDVLETLSGLVDKSLIVVDRTGRAPRFGMLGTVRAFAAERLVTDGAQVHRAHAHWCAEVVEAADAQLAGDRQPDALATLDREVENIRAALGWCQASDPGLGARIASAVAVYWHIRGRFAEGRRFIEAVLPSARAAGGELRARALWAFGLMLIYGGELAVARPVVEEAVGRARDLRDPALLARALNLVGELELMTDPPAARQALDEAVTLARGCGDDWCLADSLAKLGASALYRSDAAAARGPFEECLAFALRVGDPRLTHRALGGLARVTAIENRPVQAIELLGEGLEISRRLGDRSWHALDLAMLGELHRAAGRPADGRVFAERGLALAGEIEARYPACFATGVLGRVALALGDLDRAAESFRDARDQAANHGLRPFAAWWALGLGDVALARGEPAAATEHARAGLAIAEQTGNRRDAARACTLLALVAISRADHELAVTELTAALAIHREVGDLPGIQRSLAALIDALTASGRGERAERIAAAAARGTGALDEATALALRGHGAKQREPASGWGGLTRAEAEVAQLAAAGASNPAIGERLFMSRSTVKTHLSRVYAKLQVSSRIELAAALSRLRQDSSPR